MDFDFKVSGDFIVSGAEQLDDTDLTRSDEFWLIQAPLGQFPEIEENTLKIEPDKDGLFGEFKDSNAGSLHLCLGAKYDLASFHSQDAGAELIIPSEESMIVGKITRRVALVRYPEPNELLQKMKARTQQKLVGSVTNSSKKSSNLTQSSRHKSGTRSSREKSMFSGFTETPKSPKRKNSESSSGKHRSSTSTVSGSSERSAKSKKKVKKEE
ncbi:mediator-associated protein [Arabidopsis thaliana]|uniref:Mediator-associated protein 2 n=1 Tax=Arabidopsis thaliana TaxID=3702 RepID=MDA2_ARATH|nr:mediator-associated protein [Arabidopsis thaliana]F4KF27.1 RecName: Full=Mediator-associated protein 2 [Arabidopsis thaliana]AED97938.1 mediator-associated protein [Arabidopsis thaliana]|eukprot:NP_001154796.1 mediator-associated protein [Arabidopsis thaliana]